MSENSGSLRRGQRHAKETAQLEQICDRLPNLCILRIRKPAGASSLCHPNHIIVVHQYFSKVISIAEVMCLHCIYVHNHLDDTANVYRPISVL